MRRSCSGEWTRSIFSAATLRLIRRLRRRRSRSTLQRRWLSVEEAALGILEIVNNNMALAINANSVAKGVDPRNFTLMGFGGAGPAACRLAGGADLREGRDLAAASWDHRRDGPAGHRPAIRIHAFRSHRRRQSERGRISRGSTRCSKTSPRGARTAAWPTASRWITQRFPRSRSAGMSARASNCARRCRTGRSTPDNVGGRDQDFYDAHKQVYGHAFEDQLVEIVTLRVVATSLSTR